jgi:hypothetical protein
MCTRGFAAERPVGVFAGRAHIRPPHSPPPAGFALRRIGRLAHRRVGPGHGPLGRRTASASVSGSRGAVRRGRGSKAAHGLAYARAARSAIEACPRPDRGRSAVEQPALAQAGAGRSAKAVQRFAYARATRSREGLAEPGLAPAGHVLSVASPSASQARLCVRRRASSP